MSPVYETHTIYGQRQPFIIKVEETGLVNHLLCWGAHTGDVNVPARVPLSGYLQFKYQTLSRNLPSCHKAEKSPCSQAAQLCYIGDKHSNLSLGKGRSIIKSSESLAAIQMLAADVTGNLVPRGAFPHSWISTLTLTVPHLCFSPHPQLQLICPSRDTSAHVTLLGCLDVFNQVNSQVPNCA